MKKLYSIITYVLIILSMTGCEKFLEIDRPINRFTSDYVFESDQTAEAATIGMYARATRYAQSYLTGITTKVTSIVSDEIIPRDYTASYNIPLVSNDLRSDIGDMNKLWQYPYEIIYHCNAVIDKLSKSEQVTPALKARLMAEAKCFRAFHYFYLVNFYGEIPLTSSPDFQANSTLSNSSIEDVYALIVRDLEEAYAGLSDTYYATETVRMNKWTACALLARTYLYLENWEKAERYSRELINSLKYRLVDVDSIVLNSNPEAIFQISMSNTSSTNAGTGSIFLYQSSSTRQADYHVTDQLLGVFEAHDARQGWLSRQQDIYGNVFFLPFKYKIRSLPSTGKLKEHLTLFRLGEQYLILAEALAQQGNLSDAVTALDVIRNRAGITLLKDMNTVMTKKNILDLVMDERQRELCFEFGHRWLDLNRTGRAAEVFSNIPLKNWQATDRYFPIPQAELLLNPFLKQNPGYE